ncbi:ABC transporter permease [Thermanaerovibrio acidaminovorans]|jgi:simple sugar transport system permease protein|uniref:Inner-membrane translocator n=1 Tax=Thermanaerovibrio acidaminovorans (strain ATCC 49978 / DSM 6589 / Su883) TaxID=525903 RepID=D1B946_THEAS|nr:ABC transporter permease [Thermanaerovibrio acidaminovorans]ACZ18799.1 inner-membrane translocator [Thermanaerovibrio acidaminovorans DSM 6589]
MIESLGDLMDNLSLVVDYTLIRSTIRSSMPIIYAAMACVITQQADILNIGVEGIMLCGAFAAVAVSYFSGSWLLALGASVLVGILLAAFMAVAHIKYKSDIFVAGMGINMFALAITKLLLNKMLNESGSFMSPDIVPMPRIDVPVLASNDVLNSLFNNYSIMEPLGFVLVLVLQYLLYRTIWGLRLRCVGMNPKAAETAGIRVDLRKFEVMIYSGIIGGVAGAYLSLGYSRVFAENMTNGRGFMGVAAMLFGGGDPIKSMLGCFIFGLADSIGARLQTFGFPSQFILMIPYIATASILSLAMYRKLKRERVAMSAVAEPQKE